MDAALLTPVYYQFGEEPDEVWRCKTCRHRFRQVFDPREFAHVIVAPVGKVLYRYACPGCQKRLRALGAGDTRVVYDQGVVLPGVNDGRDQKPPEKPRRG